MNVIFLPILIPLCGAILSGLIPGKAKLFRSGAVIFFTILNLVLASFVFQKEMAAALPWAGFGFEFKLRLYHFSAFIILASAVFAFLIALYSSAFVKDKPYARQFFFYYLISLCFINGAALSDNLLLMLFFWEGLLVTLFGMIAIGNSNAFKAATKAFVILGITDLTMMVGIAIAGKLAGTFSISEISLPVTGLGALAFVCIMIGAVAKAGSMPFHSWIPDAAIEAPLPFMAVIPAALDKLLGVYFLARISLDMFRMEPSSWASYLLMIIGAATIILAVMMALVQKDFKRLLSYHAVSQVGYMVLGIGTALPVGIVGGLFHMVNNALYKSCLFLTGGSVETQTGTTELEKLGGIARKMPVTFICFIVAAVSISGVPPFNGFFSKELIYDGALERGTIFYIAAIVGSFLTAASFLKLAHAAFLGKPKGAQRDVKEAPLAMLIPMVTLAFICVLFGVYNKLPLATLIQPVLGQIRLAGHDFWGFPKNFFLLGMTVLALALAIANHIYGVRRSGSGLKASDHIRNAPVLKGLYDLAQRRFFDPYDIWLKGVKLFSGISMYTDRAIDSIYNVFLVRIAGLVTSAIRMAHTGSYKMYIVWAMAGSALIALFVLKLI